MPPTSSADPTLVKKAVEKLQKHPTLTVPEAMQLAGFPPKQVKCRSTQRIVIRALPGKKKGAAAACSSSKCSNSISSVNITMGGSSDLSPLTDGSATARTTSSQQNENSPLVAPPPTKKKRLTSKQKQDQRVDDLKKREHFKAAHKAATKLYNEERKKGNDGMTVRSVAKKIKTKFGVGPSSSTIHHYVADLNRVGLSPLKTGHMGNIETVAYQALCTAFSSKIRIMQLNGKAATRSKQIQWLMDAMKYKKQQATDLLVRLSRDCANDLTAGKINHVEERRVKWTTFTNLDLWFNAWEKVLDEYGFIERDPMDGKPTIPEEMLRNILNFDETSLSLDGSTVTRGGRPEVMYQDPRLPQLGKSTSKTSQTTTMITGSNAWGEALPPHFQFMSSAQTEDGKQIRNECVLFTKRIVGKFGREEEVSLPVTFGVNEKGGMNDDEFSLYIKTAIMPLYPNAAPEKGKWVILKCDSGPGRMNIDLLADLRSHGFILFPGVPNTTAVTQETDQNYGSFKGEYARNLDRVVEERIEQKKTTSIPAWMVGLIVFGGTDPETNLLVTNSAFDVGFSRAACRHAWEKVGAAPLTRACLNDKKVRKSVGEGDDEYQELIKIIQDGNDLATHTLSEYGYDGSALKDEITVVECPPIVTVENSLERRLFLSRSNTQGKKFSGTGGLHLTSDDVLIGAEYSVREKDKERLMKEKAHRMKLAVVEAKGKLVLETKGDDIKKYSVPDLDALLAWYQVPKKNMLRKDKEQKWESIRSEQPPAYERWTDNDENELKEASRSDLEIGDTALGRLEKKRKKELVQAATKMTEEEWEELVAARSTRSVTGSSVTSTTDTNNN